VGTVAMLAVGGGIIVHETHILHTFDETIKNIPMGSFLSEIIIGGIVGFITIKILSIFEPILNKIKNH
jgi:predicted DNA repair protein MutK